MGLTAATSREALEHLKRAVELDASDASGYLALADVLRPIDPARATRLAQRAAELDPGQPLAPFQMAVDSLSIGEFGGALLAAARGQAMAPALPWWEPIRRRARLAGAARATDAAGVAPSSGQTGREAGDFPRGRFSARRSSRRQAAPLMRSPCLAVSRGFTPGRAKPAR